MKDFIVKNKSSILFNSIMFAIVFIILHFLLKIVNIEFRQWVYYFAIVLSILGIFIGIVQIVKRKGKKAKIIVTSIEILIVLCILMFWKYLLLFFAFSYTPEHIVYKNEKKYVAKVTGFLKVDVYYYDYINFLLQGKKVKIHEFYGNGSYDPFEEPNKDRTPIYYNKYDNKGKIIETNNEYNNKSVKTPAKNENLINDRIDEEPYLNIQTQIPEDTTSEKSEILYEKIINDYIAIRIVYKGAILAQRSVIGIEKTVDGGNTWVNQLEMYDGYMQIHNGAQFVFLDENTGFINDPGLVASSESKGELLVTNNSGKTFNAAVIVHPDDIEEENLFIDGIPYLDNDILKLKIYTINYNKEPSKIYYEFSSKDSGLTWQKI